MSMYSFENQKSITARFWSFHLAAGKMKTAILQLLAIASIAIRLFYGL
ncbi:hypothetical protein [Pseudanabaena sp. ABRG5-3]|nr:hypothetical protein [Pseudanabaena sp. ABRG5-3]